MPLNKPGRSGGILPYLFLYIPVVWAALLIAQSLGNGLPELLTNLTAALQTPLKIRWTEHSLMSILACTGAYIIGICLYCTTQGRTRDGEEHGSAQWASPKQVNAMFCQKQNKPLTQNVRLGLDTHKHRRSLNVLVIGGSGAAKTRSYVLPNILEANTNYVITDPKMEVLTATGGYLKSQGYDVRVLNLVNLEQSDGYNPFRYIRDEKDALRLVNNLIQATTPKNSHESDPFSDQGRNGAAAGHHPHAVSGGAGVRAELFHGHAGAGIRGGKRGRRGPRLAAGSAVQRYGREKSGQRRRPAI